MRKRSVIISTIVLFIGLILIGIGIFSFHMKNNEPEYPVFDVNTATEKDSGKRFRIAFNSTVEIDDEYTILYSGETAEELTSVIGVIPDYMDKQVDNYVYKGTDIGFTGIVTYLSDEEYEGFKESAYQATVEVYKKYEPVRDKLEEILGMTLEEAVENDSNSLRRWKVELIQGSPYSKLCFMLYPGILISLFALIVDLCFIFGWKKKIVIPAAVAALLVALFFMFFGIFRTMFSIEKHGDQMYSMTNYSSNHVDAMLNANIASIQDCIDFVLGDILYGFPIEFDKTYFACSSFFAKTASGENILGRNFDHPDCDTVVVYSNPKDGYASLGITTPFVVGVGHDEGMI